jgi:hypothetical protein
MSEKNHDRSPDKMGFSVALPRDLVAKIQSIAKSETRSRNAQIQRFLELAVREWSESQNGPPGDPPSSAKPPQRAGNCQAASIGRVGPGPVKRKSRTVAR